MNTRLPGTENQAVPPLGCLKCRDLQKPLRIENRMVGNKNPGLQEFPDSFMNLQVPVPDLLLYYRNTEERILRCRGCGSWFHYRQIKQGDQDFIQESLTPLNDQELLRELENIRRTALGQAQQYGSTYQTNLNRILRAADDVSAQVQGL